MRFQVHQIYGHMICVLTRWHDYFRTLVSTKVQKTFIQDRPVTPIVQTDHGHISNPFYIDPVGSSSQNTVSKTSYWETKWFIFLPFDSKVNFSQIFTLKVLHRQTNPMIDAQNRQSQLQALDLNRYKTLKGKLNNLPNFKEIQRALDDATPSTLLLRSQNAAKAAEPALETLSKIAVIAQRTGSVNIDEVQSASRALIAFLEESATPSINTLEETLVTPGTYINVPNSLEGLSQNPEYPSWMRSQVSSHDGVNVRENPQMAGFGKETSNHFNMMKFDVRGRPEFYQEIKAGDDILSDPTSSIINKNEVLQRIYKRIDSDIKFIEKEPQESLVRLRKHSEIMGWIEVLEKPRPWEGLLAPTRLDKLELISLERALPYDVRNYALNAWTKLNNRYTESAKGIVMEALPDSYKSTYGQRLNWDSTFRGLMNDQKRYSELGEAWDAGGPLKTEEWKQLSTAEKWEQRTLQVMKQFVEQYDSKNPSLAWLDNLNRDLVEDKLKLVKLTPSRFPNIQNFAAKQLDMLKPHNGKDPLPLDNSYGIPGFLSNGVSRS
ncbi:uncharacterized protein MELLADRAFT_64610 [Melampsora larici-populina 98AG31]|uniref:Uncharacterized protein n=1 Tax=Melampsora larici-populina (strain 98AG31 / pathotype 3-4-7) TaxID=747676 RepID=F4RS34_MELLP|nr:uncharacterized protein MELLADRAFT_64610 [Melampsora larici-populina 98AG31]EGG04847.1 hypothetical protein MELLADRAFT_64610 [Melampsora larici-populina 98AG31]